MASLARNCALWKEVHRDHHLPDTLAIQLQVAIGSKTKRLAHRQWIVLSPLYALSPERRLGLESTELCILIEQKPHSYTKRAFLETSYTSLMDSYILHVAVANLLLHPHCCLKHATTSSLPDCIATASTLCVRSKLPIASTVFLACQNESMRGP